MIQVVLQLLIQYTRAFNSTAAARPPSNAPSNAPEFDADASNTLNPNRSMGTQSGFLQRFPALLALTHPS